MAALQEHLMEILDGEKWKSREDQNRSNKTSLINMWRDLYANIYFSRLLLFCCYYSSNKEECEESFLKGNTQTSFSYKWALAQLFLSCAILKIMFCPCFVAIHIMNVSTLPLWLFDTTWAVISPICVIVGCYSVVMRHHVASNVWQF